jgi:predicted GNAT superfamily acetyltransferase
VAGDSETTIGAVVTIDELRSLAEIEEWQATEAAVWTGSELEVLPSSILVTLQRYGGLLLGARDRHGAMVGILLGFPGIKDGRLVHCSHLLGVLPEWRSKDVGYWMKLRQREYVMRQSLDLVVWTFDPLETRNARLNVGRLGGMCYEYFPNLYGSMTDSLNHGMESDRFQLSWYLRHPYVVDRLAGRHVPPDPRRLIAEGVPVLTSVELAGGAGASQTYARLADITTGGEGSIMLVEAPSNFQMIKVEHREHASEWRIGMRTVMLDLFARGYAVVDMVRVAHSDQLTRCYYVIGPRDEYARAGA